ncbi:MAG: DnaT-like ssDNA-binding protein [Planctomycetota bacterium]
MALIVEDGSIVENANGYDTVANVKSFWDDRGFDHSAYTDDAVIGQAIVKATDFLDGNYRWKGEVVSSEQSLQWPRYVYLEGEDYDDTFAIVPDAVRRATAEYARLALSNPLESDPATGLQGAVRRTDRQVGPLRKEIEYAGGGASSTLRRLETVDGWLSRYTVNFSEVLRA